MNARVAAVLCLLAGPAFARDFPGWRGVRNESYGVLAMRAGYGIPMGEAAQDLDLDEAVESKIPLWIELGSRGEKTFGGLYFQYAPAQPKADCPDGVSCSVVVMRAGLEIIHSFSPRSKLSPWAGVGIGWEGMRTKQGDEHMTVNGFEFANVQVGADVAVGKHLAIGPYLTMSFTQYTQADGEKIDEKGIHEWLQFGLRSEMRFK